MLYAAIGTGIAVYSRRFLTGGEADFYIASNRLGGIVSALTYASTTYSAFMMVGLVGLAFATGTGALGFELVYLVATLFILSYFAPRVWKRARERGWVTPAEMISDHYQTRAAGAIISIIYFISLIPYASLQMKGIGEITSQMVEAEWGYILGVLFGALLVLVWSMMAGIWSVALTDAFQGLVMLTAGLAYFLWVALAVHNSVGLSSAIEDLGSKGLLGISVFWSPQTFVAFTLPWAFFAMIHPQVVQRIFMPKDKAAMKKMIMGFAAFGLLYTLLSVSIGMLARAMYEGGQLSSGVDLVKSRDLVTPTILSRMDPLLSSLIFVSILSASVTTANSIALTLASVASRDLGYSLSEEKRRLIGYATMFAFTAISAAVAATRVGYIVDLAVLTTTMLLPLVPVTLLAWMGIRAPGWSAVLSVIAGFATVIAMMISFESPRTVFLLYLYGLPSSLIVIAVSGAVLVMGVIVQRIMNRG